jgi:hypothetical protein
MIALPGSAAMQHLGHQIVFGGEVVVNEAAADVGRGGDVGDTGARHATLDHHLPGGLQQLGAAAVRDRGAGTGLGTGRGRAGRRGTLGHGHSVSQPSFMPPRRW